MHVQGIPMVSVDEFPPESWPSRRGVHVLNVMGGHDGHGTACPQCMQDCMSPPHPMPLRTACPQCMPPSSHAPLTTFRSCPQALPGDLSHLGGVPRLASTFCLGLCMAVCHSQSMPLGCTFDTESIAHFTFCPCHLVAPCSSVHLVADPSPVRGQGGPEAGHAGASCMAAMLVCSHVGHARLQSCGSCGGGIAWMEIRCRCRENTEFRCYSQPWALQL